MKKAIIAAALTALIMGVGIGGASTKPKTVTKMCVGVQHGQSPSRYDLNLYGKYSRVCIVGKPGKNGKNGKAGAAGTDGVNGTAGAKGDTGSAGANGAQGEVGPAGAEGPAGPQGETGATGAQGPAGETGATGADGVAGPTGPQGPQGEPGPGPLGTAYLCKSNGGNTKGPYTSPDDCNPGHDEIWQIDAVQVQP